MLLRQFFSILLYPKTAVFTLAAFAISLITEIWVHAAYRYYRFKDTPYNGLGVAGVILDSNELGNMEIYSVGGQLTDHYHPRKQQLFLSKDTVESASVASMAIAAHECGHALQHSRHVPLFYIRWFLVPVVNFCSSVSMPMVIIGSLISYGPLLNIGIIAFAASTVFYLATFPLEVDASVRGMKEMVRCGLVEKGSKTYRQCKWMLAAAASTYLAALAASLLNLIKMLVIVGVRGGDNE